jgi:nucleoside-diphosphate-sugar epimerase
MPADRKSIRRVTERRITMRVFVAGASGAIGARLVPQLIDRGHKVTGTHVSPAGADRLRALGAEPVALDLLDARAVRTAVLEALPEAIVHQATALKGLEFKRNFDALFAGTNRLRTEGTDALLTAAREAGVERFVAQSYASVLYPREGGPVKTEDDPLDPSPLPTMRESVAAMRHLEEAVTGAGGIVLRYGTFYGAANDGLIEPVRKRQFPIIGDGGGVWSFIPSRTPRRRPWSRSRPVGRGPTTSSTTSPPRCANGCPCSRLCSAPSRRAASPAGLRGCSRARPLR